MTRAEKIAARRPAAPEDQRYACGLCGASVSARAALCARCRARVDAEDALTARQARQLAAEKHRRLADEAAARLGYADPAGGGVPHPARRGAGA